MAEKCARCGIEFEPKTPRIPVIGGHWHYGCYQAHAEEVMGG